MSEAEKYNGYTNFETWSMALWWDNDQGLYEIAQEYKAQLLEDEGAYELGKIIESWTTEWLEESPTSTMAQEFLHKGLNHVDWQDIAQTMLED